MKRTFTTCLAAIGCGLAGASAQQHHLATLPQYQTPVPYPNMRNADVTQNLGPTGARGWIHGHTRTTADSREILIKSIEPGSPADGILEPYDVITGAAVPADGPPSNWATAPQLKPFDSDARLSFARAITWAETEAAGGKLRLLRSRDGKTTEVIIQLQVMGSYSATSPFDCPKSERIVKHAADFLATNMPVDGYAPGVGEPLHAALLFACGNDAYLDHFRRSAMRMSIHHSISTAGHETWRWGNTNTFLCEYYLATGDERVLPTIRQYSKALADGQCNPGTWGHSTVPDFIPPGYGSLNSSGVVCFLSLALAKQCGIDYSDIALERSIKFYGSYAGRGSIPYGDHPPAYDATSNGKNGATALAFHLLGAQSAAQWFARLCASTNLADFEGGHSGNYFNQSWSPLGAALAGRENYSAFWSRFHTYRDLARRRDGSFMTQPLPDTREGDLGTGNYVAAGPMWSTGGYAISYLAGTERLAILGRRDSVFAANPPDALKPALAHYRQKDFAGSKAAGEKLSTSKNERVRRLAAQLVGISKRNLSSIRLTLADMARTLEAGDLAKLKWQLKAFESLVDPGDPRVQPFYQALKNKPSDEMLADGKRFHNLITGVSWAGSKGHEIIAPKSQVIKLDRARLAELARTGSEPYRTAAAGWLEDHPFITTEPNTTLIPEPRKSGTATAASSWRIHSGKAPGSDWMNPSFSDHNWDRADLSAGKMKLNKEVLLRGSFTISDPEAVENLLVDYSMATRMRVYLNGTLVADVNPLNNAVAKWKNPIQLKPSCLNRLKKGGNTLAVAVTPGGPGFDLKLKATTRR